MALCKPSAIPSVYPALYLLYTLLSLLMIYLTVLPIVKKGHQTDKGKNVFVNLLSVLEYHFLTRPLESTYTDCLQYVATHFSIAVTHFELLYIALLYQKGFD